MFGGQAAVGRWMRGGLDGLSGCAGAQSWVMQQVGEAEPGGVVVTKVCVIH